MNESDTADFFGIKHFPGLRRKLREGGGFDLAIVMAGTNDIRRGRLAGVGGTIITMSGTYVQ